MTNMIDGGNHECQPDKWQSCLSGSYSRQMPTIADRIGEIIEEAARSKPPVSARELSKRCGLPPTQLSTVYKKLTQDPLAVELRTLARIAKGVGVRVEWLTFGTGPREAEEAVPNRKTAATIARQRGVSPAAVDSVLREDVPGAESNSVKWWLLRMQMRAEEMGAPDQEREPDPIEVTSPDQSGAVRIRRKAVTSPPAAADEDIFPGGRVAIEAEPDAETARIPRKTTG